MMLLCFKYCSCKNDFLLLDLFNFHSLTGLKSLGGLYFSGLHFLCATYLGWHQHYFGLKLSFLCGRHWQQWTTELKGTSLSALQAPLASLEIIKGWCSPQDQVFKILSSTLGTENSCSKARYKSRDKNAKYSANIQPTCISNFDTCPL